jgi:hypothetical protein
VPHAQGWWAFVQLQQIFDPSMVEGTQFGYHLQLSGDRILLIVSAPEAEDGGGLVYIFRFLFGSYYLDQIIAPSVSGGRFGHYIDILGTFLVVGAPSEVVENGSGAVYVYEYVSACSCVRIYLFRCIVINVYVLKYVSSDRYAY